MMAETSQSVMRVIELIFFTMIFAGAWASDQPRERMAQKEMPKPTEILSKEGCQEETQVKEATRTKSTSVVSTEKSLTILVPDPIEIPRPVLETVEPTALGMTMTISIETEGLSIASETVQKHIRKLPLGIANGDYLMMDPQGGVGWLRIRGQRQNDSGETILSTEIEDAVVRYLRVTPVDVGEPVGKPVPTPIQYAGEEPKTISK